MLVYATCSTSLAENEEVIGRFLSRHPELIVEEIPALFPFLAPLCSGGFFRSWPHRDGMDGFFAARLKKK